MYLEIEIDHNRGSNKKFVTLKLDEETEHVKMKFDRRPEFDIPDFRMLRKRRILAQRKSDGSASFLRAARAGNLEKVLEFLKTNTDINTCNANGLNALHLASKEGHVHVVTELLQRGASVDAATKKGNTALHIASLAGQEEIVKVLVQHQALVNIQSQNGFTPLYMAAQENHDNVVRFLLANNANQSLATEDGFTPLAVALQQGHDKVVAVLLENDTRGKVRLPALHIAAKKDDTKAAALLLHTDHNPDVTSKSGFTPLHIAAHYGNENIANLLIQRGADVNYIAKHQITPLHVASKWGKGNMVSLLIDKGANYEAKTRDGLTPLHCAARSGHETVVDMLLEKGAPITSKTKNGLAPLHMSSQGDHVDAARILLYHKAPVDDVTVDFLTALHVAAHCGHVRVAKLLLDRKADPNSRALNGFTPLHIACKKNRIKVVELLLKHGASIEATTESGLTPLHVASFMGCMNIVIYLIQHGASADVPTVRGETPLHLAARANQTDIIRILLRNGAQVDARAREQQTALHIASRLGNSDIVVLLLQHGAAVDATTKDHYTALHIAAKEGQEEVASVLLEHGASLTSTTKKGFTPLHLAAKYGNMKVARLLLQKDAPVDAQGKNGVTPLHVAAHYDHQNVALLLLDKGASPHATAKNGYTPLHIAARKNQMDIATTLLEYGASSNAESKAGFTPLHLSSQEGHTDMATLLIEHNASPGACAKNGLTPLHLCAQEDRVNVAAILVKHGAQIDPVTKAGYAPIHVASHFGQMNMVRFLLQHGAKVDATTTLGYTPLHQAAQQGHTQIVNLLLENKAEPNAETNDGKTALSIAQRLGYISVVETLKIVTETTITTTTTTTTEEKYKVVVPETMHETFMSESEDEGGDDTMLGDQSYRYLTVDEMKSLGDDSLPIDVTKDEKMDVSFISNSMAAPPVAPADQLSPQHQKEHHYSQFTASYPSDNVDIAKTPILAGKLSWKTFLVSFMVDARGGAMRGCRHSGVRVIIPPRKAAMPTRITCRYLKKDKLVHAPPLMEGEALGSRILEMGPAGAKFLGPVIIEVPHFASLRGKEREIVILRSDNGETWREHTLEATEEAVQEVLNESFDGEELKQLEDLNTNRITRILTTDFPQYFAIVTRIRQEVHAIGPEGGMVSSTVVPQVQAVFPQGALTKKIKVGLQAQPIPTDLVAKLLGNRVAVSPIVTVEPRRRKFHKPITLTIPVPQASSKGMINQYSGEAPTLRLLCSITGGTTRAQWEDVTGSTPLTFVNDCVSFTTTVSARFWLMDCSNIPEATKMATELYREAIHVPFMAKFVVFSKRHQLEEARVRVFCMTDDREDKTLENQEMFVEVAKSRDVEVLEGKPQFLEFAGNLVPVTKSGDQLAFNFYAFRENRLPFTVRVKDQHADCIGRVAFMRQPKVGRGDPPQTPICNLNIALPDNIQPEPAPSEPDLLALEKKYSFLSISKADTIHKADLRLTDISNMLGTDWVGLARELEISDSDINIIKSQYPDNAPQQAIVMLRLWMQTSGNKANGNTLEKGLRKIGRDDIVNQCIFNVELVTDDIERAMAKAHLDQSGFEAFKEELGPSRDATLNRDISLDVSYDEKDLMKEAESAEEEEENQRTYQDKTSREQRAADMSPTYESEEKKYAGEEKVVAEEKVTKEVKDGSTIITTTTTTTVVQEPDLDSKKEAVITEQVQKEVIEDKIAPVVTIEKDEEKLAEKVHELIEEKVEEKMVEKVQEKVEVKVEEKIAEKVQEKLAEKVEEKIAEKVEEKIAEKVEDKIAQYEKMAEKVEEKVVEEKVEEKPIVDIEKHIEVVDKVQEFKLRSEEKAHEAPPSSQIPEDSKVKAVTTTEITEGPDGTTTSSTTTTERKSFITSDDGTVQEHIVIEKRTTSSVVDGVTAEEDKSDILQRLGEELGRLDEKLEEKFKEKRKTEEPEEGFTQTSVEKSQMSSTRGTADVTTAGTTVTTVQHVGEPVMKTGQALIQQMVPQPVDRRIAQQDVLEHQWKTSPLQHPRQALQHDVFTTATTTEDDNKNGRTEERGCSPITVLEGRGAEGDQLPVRPLSRSGAHTITTTTSWGAPVSTTTSIQLDDSKTDHSVQLTLHSESHVTLHAPGEIWQEIKIAKQQEQQQGLTEDGMSRKEKHLDIVDPIETSVLTASPHDRDESIFEKEHHTVGRELESNILDSSSAGDIHKRVTKTPTPSEDEQIPSSVDNRNFATAFSEKVDDDDDVVVADSSSRDRFEKESSCKSQVPDDRGFTVESSVPSAEETEVLSVDKAPQLISTVDNVMIEDSVDKSATNASLSTEREEIQITQSSLVEGLKAVCDNSVVLSEDYVYTASEIVAPSAHRPTTLMITSNSNDSTDDAECIANDPTRISGENDISQDLRQETSNEGMEATRQQQGIRTGNAGVGNEQPPHSEGGAIPRPERPSRPAPRTTTLVKVKVEKRPVGSHSQVRERSSGHEIQAIVHPPSVEEEVRGLMREVKEATSQIKQEVKELRQADTPTPDTPTPLREFREFLNREEEQDQERLPTIKEMHRESEDDASVNTGGEGLRGNEHLRLDLDSPILEHPTPVQFVHQGFDESVNPDSGYSTLEGYYAVGTDPSITTKYIPSYNEPVPEGSSNEPSIKSELESPSSLVGSSDLSPVESVCSATSPGNEKQGKSKFKSFMKKVVQLTSKGQYKPENRGNDSQGEEPPAKDIHGNTGTKLGKNVKDLGFRMPDENLEKGGIEGNLEFSNIISGSIGKESLTSVSAASTIKSEDGTEVCVMTQDKFKSGYSPLNVHSTRDRNVIKAELDQDFVHVSEMIEGSGTTNNQISVPDTQKSELSVEEFTVDCTSADELMQVAESSGSETLAIGSPLTESPFSESSATGSQFTESLITEPSTSDHSPEGVAAAFEMDSEHKKLEVEPSAFDIKSGKGVSLESNAGSPLKPDYNEIIAENKLSPSTVSITLRRKPEIGKLPVSFSHGYEEEEDDEDEDEDDDDDDDDDDPESSDQEAGKILETLIEVDETEDNYDLHQEKTTRADFGMPYTASIRPIGRDTNILDVDRSELKDDKQLLSESDIKAVSKSQIMPDVTKAEVHWSSESDVGIPKSLHPHDKPTLFKDTCKMLTKYKCNIKEVASHASEDAVHFRNVDKPHAIIAESSSCIEAEFEVPERVNKVRGNISRAEELPSTQEKTYVDQTLELVTDTIRQVCVSEGMEEMHETKEIIQPSPKFVRVTASVHQADYPQKMNIAHEIVGTPLSHNFEVQQSIKNEDDVSVGVGSVVTDVNVIHITETVSQVKEIEVKEELGVVGEMVIPDVNVERGLTPIIHGHEQEDFAVVVVHEKPVCPKYDVQRVVQFQEIEEKEMGKSEEMSFPEVNSEKGLAVIHQNYGLEDFNAVTLSKEIIYPPYTIQKAVQIQEIKEEIGKSENMSFPTIKFEKGFMTIHKGHDSKDFGMFVVDKTPICYQHVQIQELKEEMGKSEEMSCPDVHVEEGYIAVHQGHELKDFGVAIATKETVYHRHDTERAAQPQLILEKLGSTEDMSIPGEEVMTAVHKDDKLDFSIAVVSKDTACHHFEIERAAQPQISENEMSKIEEMSLPEVNVEKGVVTIQEVDEPNDFGVAIVSKDTTCHLYDMERTTQPQVVVEEMDKTEEMYDMERTTHPQMVVEEMDKTEEMFIPQVDVEEGLPTIHQDNEPTDFGLAVTIKDTICHQHDLHRAAQIQEDKNEIDKTKEMSLPVVNPEESFMTVHEGRDPTDFGVALVSKETVCHPYETEKAAQLQLVEQETGKTREISLPDVNVEESFTSVHQGKEPEDFSVVMVSTDTICHQYDIERAAQTQDVEEKLGVAEDLSLPEWNIDKGLTTIHQEDFSVVIVSENIILPNFNTETLHVQEVDNEVMVKTHVKSELDDNDIGLNEPTVVVEDEVGIVADADFVGLESKSSLEEVKDQLSETVNEEKLYPFLKTNVTDVMKCGKEYVSETEVPVTKLPFEVDVTKLSHPELLKVHETHLEKGHFHQKDSSDLEDVMEELSRDVHEPDEMIQPSSGKDISIIHKSVDDDMSNNENGETSIKLEANTVTKESNINMEVIPEDRSSMQELTKTYKDRSSLELEVSPQVEEGSLVAKEKLEEGSLVAKDKLEFHEAEQELAKIIHKQMAELIKDDEDGVEKAAAAAVTSGVSEIYKNESAESCHEAHVLESCKEPSKQNESETGECSDMEKIYVLDRVSDELRSMISSLEYNLAAGISRNIKITPILARLEQLEQEVANITKSSEATESSIPILSNVVETDNVVSSPQTIIPLSVKGAEETSHGEEKINFEETTTYFTKMPVVLGSEAATLSLPGGPSPTGETNGVDVPDALTDVEDLLSDGDQSPMLKRKAAFLIPQQDKGAITDTEDMDLSGEEDELIQEKTDLPTIQDLGLLPEPTREVINLTEGFARQPSPLLSDSEPEVDDVEGKHKKNMMKMETMTELQVPDENVAEGLTDVEDMVASGDEIEDAAEAVEDSLPEHYMDQGEGVSNREHLSAVPPTPKIFLTHHDDSSDEEQCHKQKPRRKVKGALRVEVKEGTTDVEDLEFSDKVDDKVESVCDKTEAKDKPRKKKQVRRKVHKPSKTLTTSAGDDDGLTDVEILTGDDEEEVEALEDGESHLTVLEHGGDITDSEDVEASDTEDVDALLAKPIEKIEPSVIPDPHAEKVKISEAEEQAQEESGVDTDEEGFVLEDNDDERPLVPRKRVTHEPLVTVEREALDVEEPCEAALTDTEDLDLEDKEEDEIMKDVASRIPEEGEIYTIQEMEGHMGRISKTEMIKDVHAELKQQIKEAELAGITLQEALNTDTLTDVEDLDDEEKTTTSGSKQKQRQDDQTDEESVEESDVEEEIHKKPKQEKRRGKRLPLHPQISEVRFVETEQGPLSIIVTPDTHPDKVPKDRVANVVFLEPKEKESTTDVEDLDLSDDDGESKKIALNTPESTQEPTTDTEELDIDPAEINRPRSPLPPNVNRNVFSSPKRELIHIKEDKYGVPQVTIRKLGDDELLVSDAESAGVTDTEDIEVSEGEVLKIIGVTEDSTADFELPDCGKTEVSSRMSAKEGLQVEPEEDGGSTDVEELPLTRKQRRKPKSHSKLSPETQGEDSHTDVELLSDQDDKSNLKVRVESPGAHTDMEDFETSEAEELEVPTPENAPTPDIIVNAAVKRTVILKEGPDGVVETDEAEVAPARKSLLQVQDEAGGITDVEDMEVSGAEDEDNQPDHPAVELPYDEASSVDISEKSSLPKANNEAKLIKDNLLLPEDNYNNLTDVESLSEGEGNRCASNTSLLSSQQLTYAVESCTVEELSHYLPSTDPKLCVHPGVSLESDPFCGELTRPVVVEAELEQVYYHAPKEDAHKSEVELEASDGCVVRKRQVVASLCQAREIRRFWSPDRNSPLHQSEISAFATPTIHKKGFKTILYLEQPNLLDTISISDTLCDSNYFRNERLLDFDSSSIDSFDDHFSYRDSDIVTVVDRFNQERGSSFDDLPSPHLSSIGSTGIMDSSSSGKSFCSDLQFYDSPQSPRLSSCNSRYSSEDLRKESDLTLSISGTSVHSCSPDSSLQQEVELSSLNVEENIKCYEETNFGYNDDNSDETPVTKQTKSSNSPCSSETEKPYHCMNFNESCEEKDEFVKEGSIDNCMPKMAHPVSEIMKGPAVEYHEGFTTECISGCTSKQGDASAAECIESGVLEMREGFTTECIKGYATECIETSVLESLDDLTSSDYVEIDSNSCIKNSPTAYVQRSITEWVVGHSTGSFEGHSKNQDPDIQKEPSKTCSQMSTVQYTSKPVSKCLGELTSESLNQPTIFWLENPLRKYQTNQNSQTASNIECIKEIKPTSSSNIDSCSSLLLQPSEHSDIPFEDSGVHDYQTSGSFTTSFDIGDKLSRSGYESDHISLADSVLGLEDQLDRELLQGVSDHTVTYISAQFSPASKVTCSQFHDEKYSSKDFEEVTRYPALVVPLTWRHTLPRTCSQLKTNEKLSSKISGNIAKDFEEISKDFGGVKELIDQWEVIVREEKLRSLPASPAVGRKILPPFDGNKRGSWGNYEGEARNVVEGDHTKGTLNTNLGQGKCEDLGSYDGGSVIEEVASVCDIIQQFEGRVGRLGKMNAHRQRLPRGSQSPASRSPSYPRRVATVKPLCEPQLQQEKSLPLQEGQMQQHQDHFQELMEHTVSAGFVPRVVESLSITKSSNEVWEQNPPQASVSNPEGTHEAAQIAEQQPTTLSHDQGLDVEEMSNIMESYTSDGSDLITTTYTTTSIDPDPITSTQTTTTTRITRRTEIEDGEVKEDVYEEY